MEPDDRRLSRDPQHIRQDLTAALAFALGPDPSPADQEAAAGIVASVRSWDDSQHCLIRALYQFGIEVFGRLALFHFAAKSSLSHLEVMVHPRELRGWGYEVRDLGWPQRVLNARYWDDAAPEDPQRDAQLTAAVQAWEARV